MSPWPTAGCNTDVATADEVARIRHFLLDSETANTSDAGGQLLVVIDHKETRIFRTEMKGSVVERVTPYDPSGHKKHVHPGHEFRDHSGTPNEDAYFAHVAEKLKGAEKVLVFGSGSGSSSSMDRFVTWLSDHRTTEFARIVGAIVIDESHCSEEQLLAEARAFYGP